MRVYWNVSYPQIGNVYLQFMCHEKKKSNKKYKQNTSPKIEAWLCHFCNIKERTYTTHVRLILTNNMNTSFSFLFFVFFFWFLVLLSLNHALWLICEFVRAHFYLIWFCTAIYESIDRTVSLITMFDGQFYTCLVVSGRFTVVFHLRWTLSSDHPPLNRIPNCWFFSRLFCLYNATRPHYY